MQMIPRFKNQQLLDTALTHRSALNEKVAKSRESNERLEYLGDAVLELIATEFLYHKMPDTQEGKLTAVRSALVKTTTLSEVGKSLNLGQMIHLSRGEENSGGRENETLIADTLEAILGALYLDQGIEVVKAFVAETILTKFEDILSKKLYKDPKSSLQEEIQALGFEAPQYKVVKEDGPDHDKCFTVVVYAGGKMCGQGEGKSKQLAQQAAAAEALKLLEQGDFKNDNVV